MLDLVQKLFELTQQMQHMATQNEWETVEHIQQQRLTILKQLNDCQIEQLTEDAAREAAQLLRAAQHLEEACERLAVNKRNQLTKEHGKVSKGKAMQKAYDVHRNKP